MWTRESRSLVGDCGSGQALFDDQYRLLPALIPPAKPGGWQARPEVSEAMVALAMIDYCEPVCCLPPPWNRSPSAHVRTGAAALPARLRAPKGPPNHARTKGNNGVGNGLGPQPVLIVAERPTSEPARETSGCT